MIFHWGNLLGTNKKGNEMSLEWKLRLYYGGILLVIAVVMVVAPILIVIVLPMLLAVTKWSAIAHVAENVLDTTNQRAERRNYRRQEQLTGDAEPDLRQHAAKRRRVQRRKARLTA